MKNFNLKQLLPHIVAVAIFLALIVSYFTPAFQGYSLKQADISSYIGMAKEQVDYRVETGEEALWTNAMFGGMPTFQIGLKHSANLLKYFSNILMIGLPHGINIAFVYFIGFYIFMQCLKIDPWLSILGSIAFAFSSYFYIILEAGHMSKGYAIALMGPVLGAVMIVFRGKYLSGSILLAFFLGLELYGNHFQIAFYLAFILVFYGIYEFVNHIQNKELGSFFKKTGLIFIAVAIAIGANSGRIFTTLEYAKETIRGKSELTISPAGKEINKVSSGLSNDYITQWSYGIEETYSLLVPNIKGGASGALLYEEVLASFQGKPKEKRVAQQKLDKVNPELKNYVIKELQQGRPVDSYWGNMPFTSGPVYVGAIVCFLFVLSFVFWQSKLKWYFLGVIILATLLSWGKNFMWLTDFFIQNIPMYNKFRAVSMLLVIVEFLLPLYCVFAIKEIIDNPKIIDEKKKQITYVVSTFIGVMLIITAVPEIFFTFLSNSELAFFSKNNLSSIESALVDYRVGIFQQDSLRSLLFIILAIATVFMYHKKNIKKTVFITILTLLILVDLWSVNKRYLNNAKQGNTFTKWEKVNDKFSPYSASVADNSIFIKEIKNNPSISSKINEAIVQKKKETRRISNKETEAIKFGQLNLNTNYRVYKLGNSFQESGTSFFHKSVGGYHAAKIKRYQELVDFHLNRETQTLINGLNTGNSGVLKNLQILNMMNMKYLIYDAKQPALPNPNANGNAWFITNLKIVEDADAEILALNNFNSKTDAIIQNSFANKIEITETILDSTGIIEMTDYSPNVISYTSENINDGFAVFSEIYYSPGWKAYIDGKLTEHVKVNYVLRGLKIPSGKHLIEFKFEPKSYSVTRYISFASSGLIILGFIGLLFFSFKSGEVEK